MTFFKDTGTRIPNKPATIIFKTIDIPINNESLNSWNQSWTIIAVIIEQILRQVGNAYDPVAVSKVDIAMRVRKYLYRQAWTFNLIWLGAYFILIFFVKPGQSAMPDMIWDGR